MQVPFIYYFRLFTCPDTGSPPPPPPILPPSSPHLLPSGLVLVTDAIQAMGLPEGTYALGQQNVVIHNNCAMLRGTDTLAGR